MFSAKKINGTRLYKLARKNITIEREEIISKIYNIELNTFTDSLIDFSVTCSKGTYIRVLGSDIAEKLGTIFSMSTMATTSIEEVGNLTNGPKLFQLYIHKDKNHICSLYL